MAVNMITVGGPKIKIFFAHIILKDENILLNFTSKNNFQNLMFCYQILPFKNLFL